MWLAVSTYGQNDIPSRLHSYSVNHGWKVVLFSTFIRMRSQEIILEDKIKREANRNKYDYLTYLDAHTEFYLNKLQELSSNEELLFDALMRVSVDQDKRIDLTKKWKDTSWATNITFYDELKTTLEGGSVFPWVNQTDLARLVWVKQNDISRAFTSLIKKWFIVENWFNKKKFFRVADIDLIGFYVMRYL